MSDSPSRCCDPADARTTDSPASTDRWLDERPVGDASLPPDVADVLSEFYGTSVGTIDDFVAATRAGMSGGAIAREDLCHVEVETPHVATMGGERYHFRCFFDEVALAYLADEPVEIITVSPSEATIELDATPDGDVSVTPSGTVMSLGIAADAADVDGAPTVEDVYEAVCPSVKASPSREHYEGWAAGVDAATVGLPLPAGTAIARSRGRAEMMPGRTPTSKPIAKRVSRRPGRDRMSRQHDFSVFSSPGNVFTASLAPLREGR